MLRMLSILIVGLLLSFGVTQIQAKDFYPTMLVRGPVCYEQVRVTLNTAEEGAELLCLDPDNDIPGIIEYRDEMIELEMLFEEAVANMEEIRQRAIELTEGCSGFNCIDSNGVISVVPLNTDSHIVHIPGFERFNIWLEVKGVELVSEVVIDEMNRQFPELFEDIFDNDFTMNASPAE
jgi:hypothetical protein